MYTPKHFKRDDQMDALEVVSKEPFGTLISTSQGAPLITHIPFSIVQTQPHVILCAHMAKANPQWHTLEGANVVAVFRGVHGYISARWYSNPKRDVPTWNYVAVHLGGRARIAPEDEKPAILSRLSDEMEADAHEPWSVQSLDPDYFASQAKGIVAFYIDVHTVEATFKLSQNRAAADRDGALRGLEETQGADALRLAAAMRRFAPKADR